MGNVEDKSKIPFSFNQYYHLCRLLHLEGDAEHKELLAFIQFGIRRVIPKAEGGTIMVSAFKDSDLSHPDTYTLNVTEIFCNAFTIASVIIAVIKLLFITLFNLFFEILNFLLQYDFFSYYTLCT